MVSRPVFAPSVTTCRTRVRRFSTDPLYDETFSLKAYHQTRTALVTVYNWARGVAGRRLGQVGAAVQEPRNRRPRWHRLRDARGWRVGDERLRVACDPLAEAEVSRTAEVTVVADGFCHLYELSFEAQANVKRYIRGLRLTLAKRLETLDDAPAVDWRPAAGALDALAPDAADGTDAPAPDDADDGCARVVVPDDAAPTPCRVCGEAFDVVAVQRYGGCSRACQAIPQKGTPAAEYVRAGEPSLHLIPILSHPLLQETLIKGVIPVHQARLATLTSGPRAGWLCFGTTKNTVVV